MNHYLRFVNRGKAILFLLLAVFCFVGSLPIFWLQTKYARHQMKERMEAGIDPSELQQLDFELVGGEIINPDFRYCDHGKEFKYQGRYYDIFKSEKSANRIRFWVIADELENQMFAKMLENERSNDPLHAAAKTFLKFFGKSFPNPTNDALIPPLLEKGMTQFSEMSLSGPVHDILIPPPQA